MENHGFELTKDKEGGNVAPILAEYDQKRELYVSCASYIEGLLKKLLSFEQTIKIQSVQTRIKCRSSLEEKIKHKSKETPRAPYGQLSDITDIAGIRITAFFSEHVDQISSLVKKHLSIDLVNSIDKRAILSSNQFGYLSVHFVASLSPERGRLPENARFSQLKVEIQIRSLMQHAWAEIEHDFGYKWGFRGKVNAIPGRR